MSNKIRQRALELGFQLVGITPAAPLTHADALDRWIEHGYAGDMAYMRRNRDKRADPALLLPGTRSVICLGMAFQPPTPALRDGLYGRISSYARGRDYHDTVKKKLRELWKYICQCAPAAEVGRYYVDTGPVLERELAQRAALGWCGKNTCLINRTAGSYVFLGEILTDLTLEYDEPTPNRCGSCTRCLEACPTQALVAPHVLDARRCIAYLTIESRKAVPHSLRPLIGNWIFGCDVCQQVCPWNHRAAGDAHQTSREFPGPDSWNLLSLMALNQAEFDERFRGSPIKRTRRSGLLRNVAVALGNSGDHRALPVLTQALHDQEPLIRSHAAWALGRRRGAEVEEALREAHRREDEPETTAEIDQALMEIDGHPTGSPPPR